MRRVAAVIAVLLLSPLAPLAVAPASGQTPAPQAPCPAGVPDPGFGDVTGGDVHRSAIACAVWWDLARGTAVSRYAPAAALNRDQAATLVARLLSRTGVALAASPADPFADDRGSVHAYATNRLAAAGVVRGRAPGRFVPTAPVTRGELATMLVRSLEVALGPLPAGADAFTDDNGSIHEPAIDKAASLGIARGTGDGRFSPTAALTRAQAASLLTRALEPLAAADELGERPDVLRAASNLRPFDDCDELLGHIKERALELVGPFGLGGFGGEPVPEPTADREQSQAPGSGGGDDSGGGGGFSGTNNQEVGVDEADVVKTDGRRIVSVVGGRLRVVDVSDPAAPRLAGTLALPADGSSELLLSGNRALVLTTSSGFIAFSDIARPSGPVRPRSTLTLVDLTDDAQPRVLRTLTVDGTIAASRMIDSTARVVLRNDTFALPFVFPQDGSAAQMGEAGIRNRELVMQSRLEDWVPQYELSGGGSGPLLGCGQLSRPPEHAGLGTLSVLTADLLGDLGPDGAVGVLAGGETVYASSRTLYVATSHWGPWRIGGDSTGAEAPSSDIHAFDITDRAGARYTASGKVEGFVLNQFSMSEQEGVLRVATTSQQPWLPGGMEPASESQVVTLAARDGRLTRLGSVGGLGRGERIYAVRFIGDVGYVVTFRQVDPLYTIDLSDPAAPRVVGELKILGYSAYLHPVGDGLLLGVGQDATDEGRVTGTQVALFDVSNPAAPRRLHQASLEGAFSEVEFDHRAFLWWAPAQRTVIPVSRWSFDQQGNETSRFVGAVGFSVDPGAGIREVGRVTHEDDSPDPADPVQWADSSIRRTIVVGDTVLTVSERGIEASSVTDLTHRGWLGF